MILFLLLVLATYRFSLLLAWDTILAKPRNYIGVHSNDFVREWLGYLVHCPYCIGLWTALILAIIYYPRDWLLMTFATAGGQAFLQGLKNDSR